MGVLPPVDHSPKECLFVSLLLIHFAKVALAISPTCGRNQQCFRMLEGKRIRYLMCYTLFLTTTLLCVTH
jgi:hypothetical protein